MRDPLFRTVLPDWEPEILEPGSGTADLPESWVPIARSADPQARVAAARQLWPDEILALLPRFAEVLRTQVEDVRACLSADGPALIYVVRADEGEIVTWVGFDPRTVEKEPLFWTDFPSELRRFLSDVHAGFVSRDFTEFGPTHPAWMQTFAERAAMPEGVPDWDAAQAIASTRLLVVSQHGMQLLYCLSPDLGPDRIALLYEGDIDPKPLWPALDDLLMERLDG
jgi:hypothetical protein